MNDTYGVYRGKYQEFIESKLAERPVNKRFGYSECHHIIPECLGGTWDDGYVYLYPREHFLAHSILVEENPESSELRYALWRLSNDGRIKDSIEYEEIRKSHSDYLSIALLGEGNPNYGTLVVNDGESQIHIKPELLSYYEELGWVRGALPKSKETKFKLSKSLLGHRVSEDTKKRLSSSQLEYLKNHDHQRLGSHLTEESKEKIRASKIGKTLSEETKHKISLASSGRKHTQESKEKISKANKGNKSNTGKVCINDGERNYYVYKELIEEYIGKGYNLGRLKK